MLTNKDIARLLKDTAALIELTGGNTFRARAFSTAARTIERLDEPVEKLVASNGLKDVRGIGDGLALQIAEILERGTFDLYEDLLGAIPPGLSEVLRVKGLGAKKVRTIWQTLGITTLEELEEAATIGRLVDLPGFGAKSQDNILEGIRFLKQFGSRRRYSEALIIAEPVLLRVRELEGITEAEFAGELRRKMETVGNAVIVAAAMDPEAISANLEAWWAAQHDSSDGYPIVRGRLPHGLPIEVHLVPPDQFGTILWKLTGSGEHVEAFVAAYGEPSPTSVESAVYSSAGLAYVVPELREGRGELEAAATGELPRLVELEDLRGILHNHSTYSDGAHPLRTMVETARSMGYSYYGVCDHSQSLTIAGGLTIDRVRAQQEEIRRLNDEFTADDGPPFRIFSGTESDILFDGSLDFPEDVLASFDFVVASVHSHFRMSEEDATKRIVRAVENPYTRILGHPTGRLLLRRTGYAIDHARVIDACAANGVSIEINANPRRLDLDWRWVRRATDRGILIAINPDAHSIDELYYPRWGVAVARKGWLTPDQCLNAKPLESFVRWIEEGRDE